MQLTAGRRRRDRRPHGRLAFRVSDLYDPEINVRYGAWYLRHLLDKYGDERLALAAYNAGQDNVDRWRARARDPVLRDARVRRAASSG
jgi:soluble lytic murein transglycosylase